MNPAGPDTEVVTHVVTDFRLAQARESRLAWYFAGAYLLVIVYASLSPFSGWATPGVPPLAFLDEPWPRRWQRFDLLINGAAYLPLGLLLTLATMRWIRPLLAVLLATLAGSALSFGLETAQMYLPGRVASSVDLILNTVGTLLGGVENFERELVDGMNASLARIKAAADRGENRSWVKSAALPASVNLSAASAARCVAQDATGWQCVDAGVWAAATRGYRERVSEAY
jgi:VanZ family protein